MSKDFDHLHLPPLHAEPVPKMRRLLVKSIVVLAEMQDASSTCIDSGFSLQLNPCSELPYSRRQTLSQEWCPLDAGWVEHADLVCLQNLDKSASIEVSFGVKEEWDILIPPLGHQFLWVRVASAMRLRSSAHPLAERPDKEPHYCRTFIIPK